jgi:hypothetical protein
LWLFNIEPTHRKSVGIEINMERVKAVEFFLAFVKYYSIIHGMEIRFNAKNNF